MPFNGFICEVTAEKVSPDACTQCARQGALDGCPLTAPVVAGLVANLRPDDFGLTVTTLLGCPRKHRLKTTHPYWLKPREMWWAYRGQLMHGVAASYVTEDPHALAEQRFSMMVPTPAGERMISGQPDLVYPDRQLVVDYKTTKRLPAPWKTYTCPETGLVIREGGYTVRTKMLACPHCAAGEHPPRDILEKGPPRPYGTHVLQLSLYRLLLEENGYAIEAGELVYQDMGGQVRLAVALLPRAEAWTLLQTRLALFTQEALPPKLSQPDEVWECDYCAVAAVCEQRHLQEEGHLNGQTPEEILTELGY